MVTTETKPEQETECAPPIKELAPTVLNECIFWDKDDPRWTLSGYGETAPPVTKGHSLDLSQDSYIWVFTGWRGSGKTTAMTFFGAKGAYLYNSRLISNYPIEFLLIDSYGGCRHIKAEPLDLYKLLCFDTDYRNCLILIDESPDIISHMASMTWKNRLLNVFVRQLRKNHNSLFLGAQQIELLDKSFRWQTDIIVHCKDASRMYANGLERGECILIELLDNSGMWTGKTFQEREAYARYHPGEEIGERRQLWPRCMWGDKNHKPVYDTYYQQDIWESLKKVDMKLQTYQVGSKDALDESYLDRAQQVIEAAQTIGKVKTREFYESMGEITKAQKDDIGRRLNKAGVRRGGDRNASIFFEDFEIDKFMAGRAK